MQMIITKKAFTEKVELLALTEKSYLKSISILMNEYDLDEEEIPSIISNTLKQKLYYEVQANGLVIGKPSPVLTQLI